MWPFKRTLSGRYSKLVKLIKSIDSHFQLTEDKEDSLRLHLPNYKGNQPMDFHIYMMEPFLFISFVTEIEGEKISCVNNFPKDTDQQDMFNVAMSNNLNKIHQVLEDKYSEDGEEKKEDGKEKKDNHGMANSSYTTIGPQRTGMPVEAAIDDLKENFDYSESFKKHALTFMILRPNTEFWYFAKIHDEKPLWIYNGKQNDKDKGVCLMEDSFATGLFPLIWFIKKYDNKEDLCWILDFLNRQNMNLWANASAKKPQELINEMKLYIPSLRIGNDPQRIKSAIEWAWIDIQSYVRFIDYCMNTLDDKLSKLQDCSSIQELAYLMIKESGFEYKPNNQQESDSEPTIVESWTLLEFAKSHGQMKLTKPYTHINPKTGETFEARSCAFVHPTKKDEHGKALVTIVEFASSLGELSANEISSQRDELAVVKYEKGDYALTRRKIDVTTSSGKKAIDEVVSPKAKEVGLSKTRMNQCSYEDIKECANKILLSLEKGHQKELDKKLLLAELTILSAAMVLCVKDEWEKECNDFVKHKILDNFLSIGEVDDYNDWIVSNTPGMYSNDLYTTETAIPLAEFEKMEGPVNFFRGKINAYPYDDNFWGEFVDKKGNKQIVYVDQGFPYEYNVSELSKNKTSFGIVEEKDTYYHSKEVFYCLKEIRKKHSMLSSYIKERLIFYKETIKGIHPNKNKEYVFQLYNAVTNEILNFNAPYLGTDDLTFGNETVVNGETGEIYQYDANSLNNFSICIEECLRLLHHEFNSDLAIADNQSVKINSIRTDDIANDLNDAWTDEYGAQYSADKKRLLYVPDNIEEYSVAEGTEEIGDYAFANIEFEDVDYNYIMENNLDIHDFERYTSKLVSVYIPNSVVRIGKGIFDYCTKLAIINIPDGATEIFKQLLPDYEDIFVEGDISTIVHSKELEEVWIDKDGVKYSKDKRKLLKAPGGLTKYAINPHTKVICDGAFFDCANLKEIHLPENIAIIGKYAFYGCDSLSGINLPKAVLKIGEKAFDGCEKLNSLFIPRMEQGRLCKILPSHFDKFKEPMLNSVIDEKGVVYDNDYQILYFNTLPLDTYSIKSGVKTIDDFAFKPEEWKKDAGTSLLGLSLPNSVVLIGAGAFAFNQCLATINIPPKAALSYDFNPFAGCSELHTIKWKSERSIKEGTLVYNEDRTALIACLPWHYIDGVVKSWSLMDFAKQHGKMQVGEFANKATGVVFKSCIFTNPNDGTRVFVAFSAGIGELTPQEIVAMKNELQVVQLESGNYSLCKGKTIIDLNPCVEIPYGIKVIADKAFYNNKKLQEIILPASVDAIGQDAFEGCSSIRVIYIPKGTMSKFKMIIPKWKDLIVERADMLPF